MEVQSHKRVRMLRVPFNYTWPGQRVSVVRELGPCELPLPMAEAAISEGYAEPFDPSSYIATEDDGEDDLQLDEEDEIDMKHQAMDIASIT